jgi:UDP-N-acetylmuramoyl-tripeptide--D-alanyl-D-alanine ligase
MPSAFEKGATAASCVPINTRNTSGWRKFQDRLIFADDAIRRFSKLAHGVYLEWNKPVVAITGSAGKTTAKELTAHVLEKSGRKSFKQYKKLQQRLGHPMTVLNLRER